MRMPRPLSHNLFIFLFLILILSPIITANTQAETAKYSFSSNFYIFINIKPSKFKELCNKQASSNNIYYAIINPNKTISTIKIDKHYVILRLEIYNVSIYALTDKGEIIDLCNTNLDFTIKYNSSDIIMPVYNHTIAGGFPYLGLKKSLNNTTVLLVNIGTRDFEIETPEGMEKLSQFIPINVLSASPTSNKPEKLSKVAQLFKEVLSNIGTIHISSQNENTYVIEVIPNNTTVLGLLSYGIILGPPPGRAYLYHNISVPASLVSSYSKSNLTPTTLSLGSYKGLYYDNLVYFTARGARKVYVVSLEMVPSEVPNGNLHLYNVSYRWDNGLLLNATFRAFLANAAIQGFILQGPILNSIAVDSAKYGVIYGIVPPGSDPRNFLERVVSNPLGTIKIPLNTYFNVHLVAYNVSNPQVTTVEASESEWGIGITTVLALVSLLAILLIYIKKKKLFMISTKFSFLGERSPYSLWDRYP